MLQHCSRLGILWIRTNSTAFARGVVPLGRTELCETGLTCWFQCLVPLVANVPKGPLISRSFEQWREAKSGPRRVLLHKDQPCDF